MNLPTKITVTRIVMLPVLIVLFCLEMHFYGEGNKQVADVLCYVTSLLYIATALTDFLDGYLARKYNQVTTLGKFLDPIADKVCVLTGLAFIMEGNFIWGMKYVAMICTIRHLGQSEDGHHSRRDRYRVVRADRRFVRRIHDVGGRHYAYTRDGADGIFGHKLHC